MQFLFPWLLLGTLGISVPIAIHLFNRFRYKEVEWGAMELLRRAIIIRSRRIRLEDLLLMALRCLIIALIALALARPVITPTGAPWLGKSNDVSVVIGLDASFSMGHRPGGMSRFDHAAKRVREIAKTLKPGNPISLVLLADRPRFILRNEGFDAERLEAKLKETRPRYPSGSTWRLASMSWRATSSSEEIQLSRARVLSRQRRADKYLVGPFRKDQAVAASTGPGGAGLLHAGPRSEQREPGHHASRSENGAEPQGISRSRSRSAISASMPARPPSACWSTTRP